MSAAEQLREAESELATARDCAARARQLFNDAPSVQHEEAVEETERNVRRAERFREARAQAAERERAEQAKEAQEVARAQRRSLLEQRGKTLASVSGRIDDIAAVYERLNQAVSAIDALIAEDVALCRAFNGLAEASGDKTSARPLTTEEVRLAANARLGAAWDDRPGGNPDLRPALAAASHLEDPGDSRDFQNRLERVLAETDHAFGAAPLCRWLATLREPRRDQHGATFDRARHAIQLHRQLKEKAP